MENLERHQIHKNPEQLAMDAQAARGISFEQGVAELEGKMNTDVFLADAALKTALVEALSRNENFPYDQSACDAFGEKKGLGAEQVSVLARRVAAQKTRGQIH